MSFDNPFFILLHLAGFAFFISLAISGFMISAGLLDTPVARSSHKTPIPTGAGVGVAAGFGAGLLGLALYYPRIGDQAIMGQVAALAVGAALLGLLDDVFEMGAKLKFGLVLVLACGAVFISGPPVVIPLAILDIPLPVWAGSLGAILWVFVVINVVNFMDGVNGLMGSVMCVAFLGLAVISIGVGAGTPALLAFIMAASLMGFLPYNARNKALIFSGDVGALLCGFMFAVCSLLLTNARPDLGLLYVGPLLILPFLTDVLLTLLVRAKHKERLLSAHNTHLYQRLIKAGHTHMSVTALYVIVGVLMAIVTMAGVHFGMIRSIFFLSLWVCVLSMVYFTIYKRLKT